MESRKHSYETETEKFIAQAVKEGIIQESHLEDLQNGTMTTDRLMLV